jgi:hydroxymethylbilane synthase
MPRLRIATRGSELALVQAREVAELLGARHEGLEEELVHVESAGDRDRKTPLSGWQAPGVFTRRIQASPP